MKTRVSGRMWRSSRWLPLLAFLVASLTMVVRAQAQDAKPRGTRNSSVPPPVVSTSPAVPPGECFAKRLKLCVLTRRHPDGKLQAGLTDNAGKAKYWLCEGESAAGLTVTRIDYEGEKVLLRKDGEDAWVGMVHNMPVVEAAPSAAAVRDAQLSTSEKQRMVAARSVVLRRAAAETSATNAPPPAAAQSRRERPPMTDESLSMDLSSTQ